MNQKNEVLFHMRYCKKYQIDTQNGFFICHDCNMKKNIKKGDKK